jgi:NitT/TauT family transport system permease protein
MNLAPRLVSIALLLVAWLAGSHIIGTRLLPEPQTVWLAIVREAGSGALAFNLSVTLARVAVSFTIAMTLGTALGLAMGRVPLFDRLADPWLIVLLNMPSARRVASGSIWKCSRGPTRAP